MACFACRDNYIQKGNGPWSLLLIWQRKHGLEKYLDKPAELNDANLYLMHAAKETIQIEQAQRLKIHGSGTETIMSKRSVHGKFIA